MTKFLHKQKGFTLIELLVVISIIGLLSSVVLVSLNTARDRGRVASGLIFNSSMYQANGVNSYGIYNFDDGSATDKSGLNNNGTTFNVTLSNDVASGVLGKSLYFNGTNSYINVPYKSSMLINSSGFTYTAWIKPTSISGTYNMIMGQFLPYFSVNDTGLLLISFSAGGTQRALYSTNKISINKWYHVAATVNNQGYASIYIDGKLDSTSSPYTGLTGSAADLYIGQWESSGTFKFTGNIDEVKVYNYALGISEIQKQYADGLSKFIAFR